MEERTHSIRVLPEESGRRLDAVLAGRYPRLNRARWQERIRAGQVLVHERAVRPGRRVATGEEICFHFLAAAEPEVDEQYSVAYEDTDLLVILKPGNLPVHPSGTYRRNTLYTLLQRDRGADFVVHFAHRLDRETSGLLVLGKHPAAARTLSRAFRTGSVHKEYLTIVEGSFPDYHDATGWLTKDPQSAVYRKRRFDAQLPEQQRGKPTGEPGALAAFERGRRGPAEHPVACRTEFHRIRLFERDGNLSLVRATLHTGRLHQIRATLCSLGFPIVGDRMYGVDDELYIRRIEDAETEADRRRLRLARSALHCRRMSFPHPGNGRLIRLRAPLPTDLRDFLTGSD